MSKNVFLLLGLSDPAGLIFLTKTYRVFETQQVSVKFYLF